MNYNGAQESSSSHQHPHALQLRTHVFKPPGEVAEFLHHSFALELLF